MYKLKLIYKYQPIEKHPKNVEEIKSYRKKRNK